MLPCDGYIMDRATLSFLLWLSATWRCVDCLRAGAGDGGGRGGGEDEEGRLATRTGTGPVGVGLVVVGHVG